MRTRHVDGNLEARALPHLVRGALCCVLLWGALGATGCNREMRDQPRYEPLEASDFFADGQSARQPIAETVARGQLREDGHLYTGMTADGKLAETLPVPASRELIERGQERFNIYCAVCHGRVGNGTGMIVRRGFKQPESFHVDRLRQAPIGYFYDVMTNGFGVMSSYASQVKPTDRWAIAAYIRALQLSQGVSLDELPGEVQQEFRHELDAAQREPEPAAHDAGHH